MRDITARFCYRMPHGFLTIEATERGVTSLVLEQSADAGASAPSEVTNRAATQLQEYFAGKRTSFDIPLDLHGSDFQIEVWNACRAIPYGQTVTAGDIARAIGRPKSYRMVGAAIKKNPAPILVPTHRIVNAAGKAVGTGSVAELSEGLLNLERSAAN